MSCSDAETRAPAGKDRYPLRVLFWEATLRCNLFCEFCGSRCGETDTSNELTAEEICGVFKDVAGHYDASRIMINVSGGEPLLRKDLFDIMAYAVSLGYAWGIVTNGTLLTPETVARLDRCSLRTASVSIDGLKEVHDDLRGRQGCFDRTVQGIRNLKSAKSLEHLMITTVVSKKNIHQLASLREFLKSLPIHSWRVCPVDPIGRAADNSGVQLNQDEIRQMLDFIAESRRMGLPFQVTTSCSHYLGRYEYLVRDQHFHCFAGRQMGSVLANGDIFVCPNVPHKPELIQGNVRRDSFSQVWETGFACFRDDSARRVGKCARCGQYPNCRGDSLHTWNFDRQEPNFCARDLGLLPAPDRSLPEKNTLAAVLDTYRTGGGKLRAVRVRAQSQARDIVLMAPKAVEEMRALFRWGDEETEPMEQLACLLGTLWREDTQEETFIAEVRKIREIPVRFSTDRLLLVDENAFRQAKEMARESGLAFLGLVHSHPGDLEVAMSLGDYQLHKQMCSRDWRTALNLILNPQKRSIAAYAGPAANHVALILLQPDGI